MRILMVHGRGQGGRSEKELAAIWVQTLQEGFQEAGAAWPQDLKIDFPFYGDALDQLVAQSTLPTPADVVAKGPGQNLAFESFMQSALDEMQVKGGIPDAEVRAAMDPRLGQEKGIQNWGWVLAIARVIDRRLTATSSFTIEAFLRDVFLYLTRPAVTRAIDEIVEARLTNEPTIVVGHSLGSVVGYNVVRKHQHTLDLRKFVTLGSPLGLRAISSKLGVPENPAGEAGWYNAYDERDIVALNPLDNDFFPVDPGIVNNGGVDNDTDNRHGIVGYLDNRDVAAQIAGALK